MTFHLTTENVLEDLCILRSKAEAALYYAIDEPQCARAQTLIYIACDYLAKMKKTVQAMQESNVKTSSK